MSQEVVNCNLRYYLDPPLDRLSKTTKVRFVVLPSSTYLFTAGVEGFFLFHLIALRHTPQSAGLLWTRDRIVAEIST
jgi:hypothetical protein